MVACMRTRGACPKDAKRHPALTHRSTYRYMRTCHTVAETTVCPPAGWRRGLHQRPAGAALGGLLRRRRTLRPRPGLPVPPGTRAGGRGLLPARVRAAHPQGETFGHSTTRRSTQWLATWTTSSLERVLSRPLVLAKRGGGQLIVPCMVLCVHSWLPGVHGNG